MWRCNPFLQQSVYASGLSCLTEQRSSLWRCSLFITAEPSNPALLQPACSTTSSFYCFILQSTTSTFTLANRALLQLLCDTTAKSFSLFPASDIEACSVTNRAQVQPISDTNFDWFQLPVRCKTEPFQLQTGLEDAARSKGANNQSNPTSSSTLHDQRR